MNIGWTEGLLIVGVALIVFGPGKLPGLGRALGQSIKGFKQAKNEGLEADETKPAQKDDTQA